MNIIVYMLDVPELYGNLKLFCKVKNLKYNTYSRKAFPFEVNGRMVHKIQLKTGNIK